MFLVPHRPKQLPFLSGQLGAMGLFLNGRLGVSYETDIGIELYGQILHIEVSVMVSNVWCVPCTPYACQLQPFHSGHLGVMMSSSLRILYNVYIKKVLFVPKWHSRAPP